MSWQASSWALKQRVGDPVLKILLLAAANYADPDGKCWPKVETLAFDSEVSKRTIQRKLAELQELGLIRVEQQFDRRGKQIESLIFLLMDGVGVTLAPLDVGVTPACHGVGDTTLSPTDSLNNHRNKHRRAGSKDDVYSEEFENDIWKPYPRKLYGSKKKAWDRWRMLTGEQQNQVKAAIPLFAAGMQREGRPEDKIKHLQFFISERVYETVAAPATTSSGAAAKADWHKTATREQWKKILTIWSSTNDWRATWGPAPGKPGCGVPEDMIAAHNVEHRGHMFSQEELAGFRETASKHTVDNGRAA